MIDSTVNAAQHRTHGDSGAPSEPNLLYPRLRRVLSPTPTASSTLLGLSSPRFQTLPIGSRLEVSQTAFRVARKVGELLSRQSSQSPSASLGGSALIVDYGGESCFGDSFRVS